jgi:hypothetical protein
MGAEYIDGDFRRGSRLLEDRFTAAKCAMPFVQEAWFAFDGKTLNLTGDWLVFSPSFASCGIAETPVS